MAMVNSKSIKRALEAFEKQEGREPTMAEFQDLLNGRSVRKAEKTEEE